MQPTALAEHLTATYGIEVERVTLIESVHRVDRVDGAPWIARVFPSERPVEAAEGDAEILRFLEEHDYPAERVAAPSPVSVLDGRAVLVTELVEGTNGRPDRRPETFRALGDLLGRLQTLPEAGGALARPAGSWHHLSKAGGARSEDVAALDALLVEPHHAPLRDELTTIDLLDDLPHALLHPDFSTPNAMLTPDGPVLIDWTGAGRGPRVAGLGLLLAGCAGVVGAVDAVVDGYALHVTLEPDEVDRLGGAIRQFGLVLDCWTAVFHPGTCDHIVAALPDNRARAEALADKARAALAAR
ncbi:MAG TPA: aminoglycoside phosphotransferase family protein [Acidimicrobiales bacterium]|nr:aminoglycoside phosphotransferase family protein [Acidimicrobiales bacterium]